MSADEKTIKQIVQEALSKMNRRDCNTPVVRINQTILTLDKETSIVPTWVVVFSCDNPNDAANRTEVRLSIEAPPEKSEDRIKEEIILGLQGQLGV